MWDVVVMQLPKQSEKIESCQDVAVVRWADRHLALTLCDGATSGFDSGWWAWLLAQEMARTAFPPDSGQVVGLLPQSAERARGIWAANLRSAADPSQDSFVRRRAAQAPGAATLISLVAETTRQGLLVNGATVGDSLAVAVRVDSETGHVEHSAPVAPVFDAVPQLVRSTPEHSAERSAESFGWDIKSDGWDINPDRWILAMSDALGKWAWSQGQSSKAWKLLAHVGPDTFSDLVEGLRSSGELDNDDVVLVRARPARRGAANEYRFR